ncbi:hypothetical protein ACFPN7_28445 [Amycolatopsis halotolerans]|uniref:hypothetical protein n=1 Tax=Amycolatopsis halotolerans TaxID=330083 RepID=UPI003622C392
MAQHFRHPTPLAATSAAVETGTSSNAAISKTGIPRGRPRRNCRTAEGPHRPAPMRAPLLRFIRGRSYRARQLVAGTNLVDGCRSDGTAISSRPDSAT